MGLLQDTICLDLAQDRAESKRGAGFTQPTGTPAATRDVSNAQTLNLVASIDSIFLYHIGRPSVLAACLARARRHPWSRRGG